MDSQRVSHSFSQSVTLLDRHSVSQYVRRFYCSFCPFFRKLESTDILKSWVSVKKLLGLESFSPCRNAFN